MIHFHAQDHERDNRKQTIDQRSADEIMSEHRVNNEDLLHTF